MSEIWESVKNVILYVPRKIYEFITIYKQLDETSKSQAGTIEAYKDRIKKIKFYAECNMCEKIKELATTPIHYKF